jgi:hypothetical protein
MEKLNWLIRAIAVVAIMGATYTLSASNSSAQAAAMGPGQDYEMTLGGDCSTAMDHCIIVHCVMSGDECSQWNGACFNAPELLGYCGE